jgi:plasmid maintenance system antidote protein VapI
MADLLEERGWSKKEFAARLGCTPKHVSELLKGEAPIHGELASALSRVLGSTPEFWLRREADYRAARQRKEAADALIKDAPWLGEIPSAWLIAEGLVPYRAHPGEKVEAHLRYFGVGSVAAWRETYAAAGVAYRSSASFGREPGAVAAWLRRSELDAEKVRTEVWNERGFRRVLPELRALTNDADPATFVPALTRACAANGVAVVFVPTPPGCGASGCTRWLTPDRAVLVLSMKHRTNDHLWFTFFHEAGHVLLHSKKQAFLEGLSGLDPTLEQEADTFSADLLIPPAFRGELAGLRGEAQIRAFAERIGVHPGIIVGRMQHDGLLRRGYLNHLKVRYRWVGDAGADDDGGEGRAEEGGNKPAIF